MNTSEPIFVGAYNQKIVMFTRVHHICCHVQSEDRYVHSCSPYLLARTTRRSLCSLVFIIFVGAYNRKIVMFTRAHHICCRVQSEDCYVSLVFTIFVGAYNRKIVMFTRPHHICCHVQSEDRYVHSSSSYLLSRTIGRSLSSLVLIIFVVTYNQKIVIFTRPHHICCHVQSEDRYVHSSSSYLLLRTIGRSLCSLVLIIFVAAYNRKIVMFTRPHHICCRIQSEGRYVHSSSSYLLSRTIGRSLCSLVLIIFVVTYNRKIVMFTRAHHICCHVQSEDRYVHSCSSYLLSRTIGRSLCSLVFIIFVVTYNRKIVMFTRVHHICCHVQSEDRYVHSSSSYLLSRTIRRSLCSSSSSYLLSRTIGRSLCSLVLIIFVVTYNRNIVMFTRAHHICCRVQSEDRYVHSCSSYLLLRTIGRSLCSLVFTIFVGAYNQKIVMFTRVHHICWHVQSEDCYVHSCSPYLLARTIRRLLCSLVFIIFVGTYNRKIVMFTRAHHICCRVQSEDCYVHSCSPYLLARTIGRSLCSLVLIIFVVTYNQKIVMFTRPHHICCHVQSEDRYVHSSSSYLLSRTIGRSLSSLVLIIFVVTYNQKIVMFTRLHHICCCVQSEDRYVHSCSSYLLLRTIGRSLCSLVLIIFVVAYNRKVVMFTRPHHICCHVQSEDRYVHSCSSYLLSRTIGRSLYSLVLIIFVVTYNRKIVMFTRAHHICCHVQSEDRYVHSCSSYLLSRTIGRSLCSLVFIIFVVTYNQKIVMFTRPHHICCHVQSEDRYVHSSSSYLLSRTIGRSLCSLVLIIFVVAYNRKIVMFTRAHHICCYVQSEDRYVHSCSSYLLSRTIGRSLCSLVFTIFVGAYNQKIVMFTRVHHICWHVQSEDCYVHSCSSYLLSRTIGRLLCSLVFTIFVGAYNRKIVMFTRPHHICCRVQSEDRYVHSSSSYLLSRTIGRSLCSLVLIIFVVTYNRKIVIFTRAHHICCHVQSEDRYVHSCSSYLLLRTIGRSLCSLVLIIFVVAYNRKIVMFTRPHHICCCVQSEGCYVHSCSSYLLSRTIGRSLCSLVLIIFVVAYNQKIVMFTRAHHICCRVQSEDRYVHSCSSYLLSRTIGRSLCSLVFIIFVVTYNRKIVMFTRPRHICCHVQSEDRYLHSSSSYLLLRTIGRSLCSLVLIIFVVAYNRKIVMFTRPHHICCHVRSEDRYVHSSSSYLLSRTIGRSLCSLVFTIFVGTYNQKIVMFTRVHHICWHVQSEDRFVHSSSSYLLLRTIRRSLCSLVLIIFVVAYNQKIVMFTRPSSYLLLRTIGRSLCSLVLIIFVVARTIGRSLCSLVLIIFVVAYNRKVVMFTRPHHICCHVQSEDRYVHSSSSYLLSRTIGRSLCSLVLIIFVVTYNRKIVMFTRAPHICCHVQSEDRYVHSCSSYLLSRTIGRSLSSLVLIIFVVAYNRKIVMFTRAHYLLLRTIRRSLCSLVFFIFVVTYNRKIVMFTRVHHICWRVQSEDRYVHSCSSYLLARTIGRLLCSLVLIIFVVAYNRKIVMFTRVHHICWRVQSEDRYVHSSSSYLLSRTIGRSLCSLVLIIFVVTYNRKIVMFTRAHHICCHVQSEDRYVHSSSSYLLSRTIGRSLCSLVLHHICCSRTIGRSLCSLVFIIFVVTYNQKIVMFTRPRHICCRVQSEGRYVHSSSSYLLSRTIGRSLCSLVLIIFVVTYNWKIVMFTRPHHICCRVQSEDRYVHSCSSYLLLRTIGRSLCSLVFIIFVVTYNRKIVMFTRVHHICWRVQSEDRYVHSCSSYLLARTIGRSLCSLVLIIFVVTYNRKIVIFTRPHHICCHVQSEDRYVHSCFIIFVVAYNRKIVMFTRAHHICCHIQSEDRYVHSCSPYLLARTIRRSLCSLVFIIFVGTYNRKIVMFTRAHHICCRVQSEDCYVHSSSPYLLSRTIGRSLCSLVLIIFVVTYNQKIVMFTRVHHICCHVQSEYRYVHSCSSYLLSRTIGRSLCSLVLIIFVVTYNQKIVMFTRVHHICCHVQSEDRYVHSCSPYLLAHTIRRSLCSLVLIIFVVARTIRRLLCSLVLIIFVVTYNRKIVMFTRPHHICCCVQSEDRYVHSCSITIFRLYVTTNMMSTSEHNDLPIVRDNKYDEDE